MDNGRDNKCNQTDFQASQQQALMLFQILQTIGCFRFQTQRSTIKNEKQKYSLTK
jgi:hypothetical protein